MENLCQGRSAGLALARTHVRLAYRSVGLSGLGAKEDRATAIRSADTAWCSEMVPKAYSAAHWHNAGSLVALRLSQTGRLHKQPRPYKHLPPPESAYNA